MRNRRQASVVFIKLPPDSVFHIDFDAIANAGPVQAKLYEIDLATPSVSSEMDQSISIPVGIGCSGRVRIPIVGSPSGTITYRVTDSSGKALRTPRVHDLATIGKPKDPLIKDDIYICRCDGEPA